MALATCTLGEVETAQGALESARRHLDEGTPVFERLGQRSYTAIVQTSGAWVRIFSGDLDGAHRLLDPALATLKALDQKSDLARTQIAAAALALEEGQAGRADVIAQAAAAELEHSHTPDDSVRAMLIAIRAELELHRVADARKQLAHCATLLGKAGDRDVLLDRTLTEGLVLSAEGKRGEAVKRLSAVQKDAQKLGYVRIDLDAQLALLRAAFCTVRACMRGPRRSHTRPSSTATRASRSA